MTESNVPRWLAWAREIQALSQTGLTYSTNAYDTQRYQRLMAIAAEMVARSTGHTEKSWLQDFLAQPGYATPKVDVRAAIVREGKILLVQERADHHWSLPGGWADVGELPSAMVVQEVVTHCARSTWLNKGLLSKLWMLSRAPCLTRRLSHDTDVRGFVHLCLCHRR